MGSTLHLNATRECMVINTSEIFEQTEDYRNLWEPDEQTRKELLNSIDPVQSYLDWVFGQADKDSITHYDDVLKWVKDCEKEGYIVELEIL